MRSPFLERVVLEGEKARVRAPTLADAEPAFAAMHQNRAILDWLAWSGPESPADFRVRFANWAARGADDADNYFFAIDELELGTFAGALSLGFSGHPGRGRIGYWIRQDLWGRGLLTESVRLVAWLAFTHLAASELFAGVFVGNHGSRRALEKNGFSLAASDSIPPLAACGTRDQWALRLLRAESSGLFTDWRPARADVVLAAELE